MLSTACSQTEITPFKNVSFFFFNDTYTAVLSYYKTPPTSQSDLKKQKNKNMVIFVPDKAATLSRDSMMKPVVFLEQDLEWIKHLFAHLN